MRTLRVNSLISQVRSRADLQNTNFVTDSEIKSYLNQAYKDLYNEIVQANEDYYLKKIRFRAISSVLVLPTDFYKLRGIDFYYGKFFYTLNHVSLREKENFQSVSSFFRPYNLRGVSDLYRYNINGNRLEFFTQQDNLGDFVMYYVPGPLPVGEGARLPLGWEEYLILDSAHKCRVKEESSYIEFDKMRKRELGRIQEFCQQRDESAPESVIDVYADDTNVSLGDFGSLNENVFQGIQERALLPYVSECPYPDSLVDLGYRLRTDDVFLLNDDRAVFLLTTASGIPGRYGKWLLCEVRAESGMLWFSQKKNAGFPNPDGNDIRDYIRTHGSVRLTVDSQVYIDEADGFRPSCVYYGKDVPYDLHIGTDVTPFPSTDVDTVEPPSTTELPRPPLPQPPQTRPRQTSRPVSQPAPRIYNYFVSGAKGSPTPLADIVNFIQNGLTDGIADRSVSVADMNPVELSAQITTPDWWTGEPRFQVLLIRPEGFRMTNYDLGSHGLFNGLPSYDYLGDAEGYSIYRTSVRMLEVAANSMDTYRFRRV